MHTITHTHTHTHTHPLTHSLPTPSLSEVTSRLGKKLSKTLPGSLDQFLHHFGFKPLGLAYTHEQVRKSLAKILPGEWEDIFRGRSIGFPSSTNLI
mmetsp:Transcript_8077/g.7068  ORF Transcript_8077/g.7068 Transcript_8077/m.7068 type:complete len:96 (+) Transcript_8077:58-345(+)